MVNIKLTIEYDGRNYCGWQVQPNGLSVQNVIEDALLSLTGEKIRINGSGRTDSGVHALGQTATFKTLSGIPPESFSKALNHLLPIDISIISSCKAGEDFHARFSANGKHYRYLIYNRESRSPFYDGRAYRVSKKLDVKAMKKASEYFLGTHDFKGFMATGSQVEDTLRSIFELSVKRDKELIELSVKGNGFLYNMVRIIAGTILECGLGKLDPTELKGIIASGKRESAGPTLPAAGLYLVEVYY